MIMMHQRWQRLLMLGVIGLGGVIMVPTLPAAAQKNVTPQQITQAQWPQITSSTGRFAAAFPIEPTVTREADDIDGEPIEIHEFNAQTTDSTYLVAYTDLPEAFLNQGSEVVLNTVRDSLIEDMGLEGLTSLEQTISLNDYPGRQYRYSDRDSAFDMRLYLVDERIYLVAGTGANEAIVDRFMGSFELL